MAKSTRDNTERSKYRGNRARRRPVEILKDLPFTEPDIDDEKLDDTTPLEEGEIYIEDLPVESPYAFPLFEHIQFNPSVNMTTPKIARGLHIQPIKIQNMDHVPFVISTEEINDKNIEIIISKDIFEYFISFHNATFVVFYQSELELILRALGPEKCKELLRFNRVSHENLQVSYSISRKISIWKASTASTRIYALETWFVGKSIEEVIEICDLDPTQYQDPRDAIGDITRKLKTLLSPIFGDDMIDFTSPSMLSDKYLIPAYSKLTPESVPLEVYEYAYNSFHAPWLEMLKMGRYSNLYDYDINTAYPAEVIKLTRADSGCGVWKKTSEFQKEAHYGFCKAEITIYDHVKISPIFLRKGASLFSAVGTWVGSITKEEIEFIYEHDLGEVKILSGWWFLANTIERPFKLAISKLFKLRAQGLINNNLLLNHVVKQASNRIWGKFLQKRELIYNLGIYQAAPTFNPIYATATMTRVKLIVAKMALDNIDIIAGVTIDGLLTTAPLKNSKGRELISTDSPGRFRKKAGPMDGIILSSILMYATRNRSPTYALQLVKEQQLRNEITIPNKHIYRLTDARDADDYANIGNLLEGSITLSISNEGKRYWRKPPIFGWHLLQRQFDSEPISSIALESLFPSDQTLKTILTNKELMEKVLIDYLNTVKGMSKDLITSENIKNFINDRFVSRGTAKFFDSAYNTEEKIISSELNI